MNLSADIPVSCGGKEYRLKPFTVRERIAYANLVADRARDRAIENARRIGLKPQEIAECVERAMSEAERLSSVVMSCWTLEGALTVIRLASDEKTAESLGSSIEPGELGIIAARCLGVDIAVAPTDGESGKG